MKLLNTFKKMTLISIFLVMSYVPQLYAQWSTIGNNIYNTNGGFVGIGTNTPSARLHVAGGDIRLDNNRYVTVTRSDDNFGHQVFGMDSNNDMILNRSAIVHGKPSRTVIGFGHRSFDIRNQSNQTLMRIIPEGKVGIGTGSPSALLDLTISSIASDDTVQSFEATNLTLRNTGSNTNDDKVYAGIDFKANADVVARIVSRMRVHSAQNLTYGDLCFYVSENDASAVLKEQMIIRHNGHVGIGTSMPAAKLEVAEGSGIAIKIEPDAGQSVYMGRSEANGFGCDYVYGQIIQSTADIIFGVDVDNNDNDNRYIDFRTNGTGATGGTSLMRILESGEVGIGTTAIQGYKLAVAGDVIAESMRVELQAQWPDYVFDEAYEPQTLEHVEHFIKKHQHLPGIPSAKEVAKEGINLGEMDAKLLEKIEELTLYIIDLKKEHQDLKSNYKELYNTVNELLDQ